MLIGSLLRAILDAIVPIISNEPMRDNREIKIWKKLRNLN